jgi:hypothetical protein
MFTCLVMFGPLMLVVAVMAVAFGYDHWCALYEAKRLPNRVS